MSNLRKHILASAAMASAAVTAFDIKEGGEVDGATLLADFELPSMEGYTEAEFELAEVESVREEFDTTRVGLESIQNYLTSAVATGGLTPAAGGFVTDMYLALTERVSDLRASIVMPSMESYEADGAALGQTEISMEAVTQTLKQVIEAIKRVVTMAIEAAIKFYKQHTDKVMGLKAGLEKLQASVRTGVAGVPEKDTVNVSSIEYLYVDGKIDTSDISSFVKPVVSNGKEIKKLIAEYAKGLESVKEGELDAATALTEGVKVKLQEAFVKSFNAKIKIDDKQAKELGLGESFGEHLYSGILAGNRGVYVSIPDADSDLTTNVKVEAAPKAKEAPETAPAGKASDAATHIKIAMANIAQYEELNALGSDLIEECKKMVKAVDKAGKVLDKAAAGADGAPAFLSAIKDVKELSNTIRTAYTDLVKWAAQVASAHGSYTQAIVKNLKVEKKAD